MGHSVIDGHSVMGHSVMGHSVMGHSVTSHSLTMTRMPEVRGKIWSMYWCNFSVCLQMVYKEVLEYQFRNDLGAGVAYRPRALRVIRVGESGVK